MIVIYFFLLIDNCRVSTTQTEIQLWKIKI